MGSCKVDSVVKYSSIRQFSRALTTMPRQKKELDVEKRAAVVTLRKESYTIREIAQKLKLPRSTVSDTLKRFAETGQNKSKTRSGRPKSTTSAEDKFIVVTSKRDRRKTAPEISAELNKTRGKPVSTETVRRRLCAAGLKGRVAARKALLRSVNKKKRLQWARKHVNWGPEDWKKCLFTDESKFEIFSNKRRVYVRRGKNERMLPQCILPTVKHGGGSVMVWGCFGNNQVGDLVQVKGIMKKEQYHQILCKHAVPCGKRLIGNGFVMQQDNDPKHTSKLCQKYLTTKEAANELKSMEWPPQSPDCNPIELLWDELDRAVRKMCPTSEKHLMKSLQDAWNAITSEKLQKLIDRMPKVCRAVLKARGGHFDESKI